MSRLRACGCGALATCVLALAASPVRAQDPHDPEHRDPVEQVVVTGSPLDRQADELATSTLSLSRDQVLSHLRPTLGDALANEPGMSASGFATGASRPVIRGQDALRVQVLENGLGTGDVSTLSPDHGVPINPLMARRVEVLRGPATLRYGGGAIGGVVNALSGRVPRERARRPLVGEFFLGYGLGSDERNGALVLNGAHGALGWHVDAMRQWSNDVTAPDGVAGSDIGNSDVDAYALGGGAAWFGDRGRLGLAFSRFASEYGIPEDPAFIDLDTNRWHLEGEWKAPLRGLDKLRVWGSASDYQHDEVVPGVGSVARFRNDEAELRLEANHAPVRGVLGALGFAYRDRDFEAGGEAVEFLAPTDTRSLAVYLWEELPVSDAWVLQFGARIEDTRVEGTPAAAGRRSRDFHPVSVSAGASVALRDSLSAGMHVFAMQRAADAVELFARGPHEATETFELGDPGLDEERSLGAELSLRAEGARASGELNLFYTAYSDYILGLETGRSCDETGLCIAGPGLELAELVYLQDDAVFYGGELAARVELMQVAGGHVGADVQVDVVRGRLDTGDVPRQPPLRYGIGLHYTGQRWSTRVGFLRHRKQRNPGPNERETGAYTHVDATLQVRLLERDRRALDLHVSARNLLDERGRNALNFRRDEVPLPGRVVRVGLHGRF